MNAKDELLELTNGERIEAIMIGSKDRWLEPGDEAYTAPTFYPSNMIDEALKVLDFEFNSGFGAEEGFRLYAWTPTKVIIKTVYDGAESYVAVPRNPQEIVPDAYGGG